MIDGDDVKTGRIGAAAAKLRRRQDESEGIGSARDGENDGTARCVQAGGAVDRGTGGIICRPADRKSARLEVEDVCETSDQIGNGKVACRFIRERTTLPDFLETDAFVRPRPDASATPFVRSRVRPCGRRYPLGRGGCRQQLAAFSSVASLDFTLALIFG